MAGKVLVVGIGGWHLGISREGVAGLDPARPQECLGGAASSNELDGTERSLTSRTLRNNSSDVARPPVQGGKNGSYGRSPVEAGSSHRLRGEMPMHRVASSCTDFENLDKVEGLVDLATGRLALDISFGSRSQARTVQRGLGLNMADRV